LIGDCYPENNQETNGRIYAASHATAKKRSMKKAPRLIENGRRKKSVKEDDIPTCHSGNA